MPRDDPARAMKSLHEMRDNLNKLDIAGPAKYLLVV